MRLPRNCPASSRRTRPHLSVQRPSRSFCASLAGLSRRSYCRSAWNADPLRRGSARKFDPVIGAANGPSRFSPGRRAGGCWSWRRSPRFARTSPDSCAREGARQTGQAATRSTRRGRAARGTARRSSHQGPARENPGSGSAWTTAGRGSETPPTRRPGCRAPGRPKP